MKRCRERAREKNRARERKRGKGREREEQRKRKRERDSVNDSSGNLGFQACEFVGQESFLAGSST